MMLATLVAAGLTLMSVKRWDTAVFAGTLTTPLSYLTVAAVFWIMLVNLASTFVGSYLRINADNATFMQKSFGYVC